jgi:hypothetical protein
MNLAYRGHPGSSLRALNIHPTRECKVEIRHSEILNPLNPESPAIMQFACFYAPDGKCVGTRTVERLVTLRQLHDQHTNTQNTNNNSPSFAADAIDLIRRHRPRKDDHLALRHWRVPTNVRQVISRHFHTTTERFTTPLLVTPGTSRYWSEMREDEAFSAHYDPYSVQWTGHSQAYLPTDAPSQYKAMHWAIWSATSTDIPTATILYLPRGAKSKGSPLHTSWARDQLQLVQHLGVTTQCPPLECEYQWTQNSTDLGDPPKIHMDIVVVWNEQARTAIGPSLSGLGQDLRFAFDCNRMTCHTPHLTSNWWMASAASDSAPYPPPSHKFCMSALR